MATDEKRRHQRFPKRLAVDVHVLVMPEWPKDTGYEAKGRTVDIGRGGVRLQLDREVQAGTKVRLRFWELPPGVRLWPLMMTGTIVRMQSDDLPEDDGLIAAGSTLAIEFSEPLGELEVPENRS